MRLSLFILTLSVAALINQQNAYSDQPNGQPWSTNPRMEKIHEGIENDYETYEIDWRSEQGMEVAAEFDEKHAELLLEEQIETETLPESINLY